MPPLGNFYAEPTEEDSHILAFAAGSGITPILSIIRSALAHQPTAACTLIYGNRNPNTIMFHEEIEDLKNEYMGRLNVIHILSDESQDIDLFRGRIDAQKCSALFSTWIDTATVSTAYICGPEDMMKTVSNCLQEDGLAKEKIRFELFASSQFGRAKAPAKSQKIGEAGVSGRMTIGGETRTLKIAAGNSLLDAALNSNLDAPMLAGPGYAQHVRPK